MSVEERLRRLEDLEAIRELFRQYAARFDRKDLTGWSHLYTEGGGWHGGRYGTSGGPEAVRAMMAERFTDGVPDGEVHVTGNPVIEIDGDRAHATSFGLPLRPGPDGTPAIYLIGYYTDDLARGEDGQWRFDARRDYIHLPEYMSDPIGPPSPPPGQQAAPAPPAAAVPPADVAKRIGRLEDIAAINELLGQYSARLDRADFDAWSQLFAPDGAWIGQRMQGVGGPAAVAAMLRERYQEGVPRCGAHVVANVEVDLDGGRARERMVGPVLRPGPDGVPQLAMVAYYEDDLVRAEDGRWLFQVRRDYTNLPPYMSGPLEPPRPLKEFTPAASPGQELAGGQGVEERLRRLEDLEAISELLRQYSARFDRKDLRAWSELFAPDGQWHGPKFHGTGGPQAVYQMMASRYPEGKPNGQVHIVSNPVVRLAGDRAYATSFGIVLRPGEDGRAQFHMIGYYVDDLVRAHDGRWLFQVRRDYTGLPPYMSEPLGPPVIPDHPVRG